MIKIYCMANVPLYVPRLDGESHEHASSAEGFIREVEVKARMLCNQSDFLLILRQDILGTNAQL
jgi:hypothetical protein